MCNQIWFLCNRSDLTIFFSGGTTRTGITQSLPGITTPNDDIRHGCTGVVIPGIITSGNIAPGMDTLVVITLAISISLIQEHAILI